MEIDFGMNDNSNKDGAVSPITNITTGEPDGIVNINKVNDNTESVVTKPDESTNNTKPDESTNNVKDNESNQVNDTNNILTEGTIVEFNDKEYIVDKNGNIINKDDNSIFVKSEDVKDFIDKNKTEDDQEDNNISIENIKSKFDIDIVDEEGKPVEFENTIEGISSYIESIIDLKTEEIQEAAINSLYEKYPILDSVLSYYTSNGNSLEGYNEVKDRRNIEINKDDIVQQENIIRESFKQFDKKGNVENYIKYLKSNNTLLDVAKDELEALQEYDNDVEIEIKEKARIKAEEDKKEEESYWNNVKSMIDSKKIGQYTIPDNFTINKDGKKIAVTPTDFWNYIYQVDNNGYSRYNKDRATVSKEERQNEDLIKAWLTFTGGSYSDLVKMAINKEKTNILKLTSKKNTSSNGLRIKSKGDKINLKDESFGFNN